MRGPKKIGKSQRSSWKPVSAAMRRRRRSASYFSERKPGRRFALALGLLAAILSGGGVGWKADTDWERCQRPLRAYEPVNFGMMVASRLSSHQILKPRPARRREVRPPRAGRELEQYVGQ